MGIFAPAIGLRLDRYASEPELRGMAFGTSAAASRLIVPNLERLFAYSTDEHLDIHVMIRHAIATYNLLFYLNADERREKRRGDTILIADGA